MNKLTFYVDVKSLFRHEAAGWVSHCPALDVWSQGDSRAQARANLLEALQLFVESCYERGVLEDVLQNAGFEPAHAQ